MPLDPTCTDYMYLLGRLAALVYPSSADVPDTWTTMVQLRPVGCIAWPPFRDKLISRDHDDLKGHIINQMDAAPEVRPYTGFDRYLLGLHHQRHAIRNAPPVTPDDLHRIGPSLFGERWQSDLARALSVNDRRVREWAAGDRSPPVGIRAEIAALCAQRGQHLLSLAADL